MSEVAQALCLCGFVRLIEVIACSRNIQTGTGRVHVLLAPDFFA